MQPPFNGTSMFSSDFSSKSMDFFACMTNEQCTREKEDQMLGNFQMRCQQMLSTERYRTALRHLMLYLSGQVALLDGAQPQLILGDEILSERANTAYKVPHHAHFRRSSATPRHWHEAEVERRTGISSFERLVEQLKRHRILLLEENALLLVYHTQVAGRKIISRSVRLLV